MPEQSGIPAKQVAITAAHGQRQGLTIIRTERDLPLGADVLWGAENAGCLDDATRVDEVVGRLLRGELREVGEPFERDRVEELEGRSVGASQRPAFEFIFRLALVWFPDACDAQGIEC